MTAEETINVAIHNAFYIGDKDECFYKHVGHTLSAIYVGNGYKNVVDYRSPSCGSTEDLEQQYKYWDDVEKVFEKIGKDKFRELASSNQYAVDFNDWYIEEAEKYKKELIESTSI